LDGSNPQTLVTDDDHVGQNDVAVYGSHIYWSTTGLSGQGAVREAGLDGSNPQVLIGSAAPVWVAVSSR
jgi:hypothetical protein